VSNLPPSHPFLAWLTVEPFCLLWAVACAVSGSGAVGLGRGPPAEVHASDPPAWEPVRCGYLTNALLTGPLGLLQTVALPASLPLRGVGDDCVPCVCLCVSVRERDMLLCVGFVQSKIIVRWVGHEGHQLLLLEAHGREREQRRQRGRERERETLGKGQGALAKQEASATVSCRSG
jgi:hypothetical protein